MPKFKLLENDSIVVKSRKLYRIKALKNFGDVKAGDKGGYVSSEDCLSQDGNAWVYYGAKVVDSHVYDNAIAKGNVNLINVNMHGNAEAICFSDSLTFKNCEIYMSTTHD